MHPPKRTATTRLIWAMLVLALGTPILLAAASPYLPYRSLPYIVGGFAGIACLALLVVQPLLAGRYLPGLAPSSSRRWHHRIGALIVALVALHIGGLYLTSPPDTLDALLLVSPTPFSVYGVLAMWCVAATALLVALRRRLGARALTWTITHNVLALVLVVATVLHALQIEGAMEIVSKWLLCLAALATTGAVLLDLRIIRPLTRRRRAPANGRQPSGR